MTLGKDFKRIFSSEYTECLQHALRVYAHTYQLVSPPSCIPLACSRLTLSQQMAFGKKEEAVIDINLGSKYATKMGFSGIGVFEAEEGETPEPSSDAKKKKKRKGKKKK